jgi:hypothetical protein
MEREQRALKLARGRIVLAIEPYQILTLKLMR